MGRAAHRNVEQQTLAFGKEALIHSDLFEVLRLMALVGTCTENVCHRRNILCENRNAE